MKGCSDWQYLWKLHDSILSMSQSSDVSRHISASDTAHSASEDVNSFELYLHVNKVSNFFYY